METAPSSTGTLAPAPPGRRAAGAHRRPPPAGAGVTRERATAAQGRDTVHRLLEAGLEEFRERGFHAVRVDDIVRRAKTSHGTFYLYFANKDDFFGALAAEALQAMEGIAAEFPVVTADEAGRAGLRTWVAAFCDAYAAHATVMRILSQADLVDQGLWRSALNCLLRRADVLSLGMAQGTRACGDGGPVPVADSRLNAVACLLMLERTNYLLSSGIQLPRADLIDQMTAIIIAAFRPRSGGRLMAERQGIEQPVPAPKT